MFTATQIGERLADLESLVGEPRDRLIHRVRHMAKAGTLRPEGDPADKRGTFLFREAELFRARILIASSYLGLESKAVGEMLIRARSDDFPIASRGGLDDAIERVRRGEPAAFVIRLDRLPRLLAAWEFAEPDPELERTLDLATVRGAAQAVVRFDLVELFRGLL